MISSHVQDGIVVVAIDRPDRHNALVPELAERLVDELRLAGERGQPVVLTGTGSTFCPGADLKWMGAAADPARAVAELVALHHLAVSTLLDMPVPVIAALNGAVAGGGLGLAVACDYRVAMERATFTAAYFRIGLTPDGGSTILLPQIIGRARMLELLLTNKRLTARQAHEWGLVHEVVPDDQALQRAVAFARGLEAVPGYALRQARSLIDTMNIRNQLQRESVAIRTAARGPRFREALRAFVEAHPD